MDGYTRAIIEEQDAKLKPWQRSLWDFADWLLNKAAFPYVACLLLYAALLWPFIRYYLF